MPLVPADAAILLQASSPAHYLARPPLAACPTCCPWHSSARLPSLAAAQWSGSAASCGAGRALYAAAAPVAAAASLSCDCSPAAPFGSVRLLCVDRSVAKVD